MKHFFKTIITASLLSAATLVDATPAAGTWKMQMWGDSLNLYQNYDMCIQSSGDWYISTSSINGWKGKWFSKGNDTHFQTLHSSGTAAMSSDVSRVNNTLLAGYHKFINNTGTNDYYTMSITFKKASCDPYVP